MEKTTEPMLREFEAAGAIRAAKIVKTVEGYVLVVQISWRLGELVLFSQRGHPRAWVSMDRMLAYLAEVTPSLRHLDVIFDPPESWGSANASEKQPTAGKGKPKPTAKKRSSVLPSKVTR